MTRRSKPARRLERGAVVKIINAATGRAVERAVVMKRDKPYDPYTPAEFVVCSIRRGEAHLQARSPGLLTPVGKVKKIPKVCRAAMRRGDIY